ncbi:hypothetical protein MAR_001025 [Mya arenaria]|uniref:BZIP domain-containing protein n=1 Tax=Mya arenaria TaxID=6604 RepID=A0ABY7FC52_MYAAR|nr:uncharacterized protein LOC128207376 [Mya arenaria]WAR19187.1 hypothetical protein MAR_001025 [Mya arenaria]
MSVTFVCTPAFFNKRIQPHLPVNIKVEPLSTYILCDQLEDFRECVDKAANTQKTGQPGCAQLHLVLVNKPDEPQASDQPDPSSSNTVPTISPSVTTEPTQRFDPDPPPVEVIDVDAENGAAPVLHHTWAPGSKSRSVLRSLLRTKFSVADPGNQFKDAGLDETPTTASPPPASSSGPIARSISQVSDSQAADLLLNLKRSSGPLQAMPEPRAYNPIPLNYPQSSASSNNAQDSITELVKLSKGHIENQPDINCVVANHVQGNSPSTTSMQKVKDITSVANHGDESVVTDGSRKTSILNENIISSYKAQSKVWPVPQSYSWQTKKTNKSRGEHSHSDMGVDVSSTKAGIKIENAIVIKDGNEDAAPSAVVKIEKSYDNKMSASTNIEAAKFRDLRRLEETIRLQSSNIKTETREKPAPSFKMKREKRDGNEMAFSTKTDRVKFLELSKLNESMKTQSVKTEPTGKPVPLLTSVVDTRTRVSLKQAILNRRRAEGKPSIDLEDEERRKRAKVNTKDCLTADEEKNMLRRRWLDAQSAKKYRRRRSKLISGLLKTKTDLKDKQNVLKNRVNYLSERAVLVRALVALFAENKLDENAACMSSIRHSLWTEGIPIKVITEFVRNSLQKYEASGSADVVNKFDTLLKLYQYAEDQKNALPVLPDENSHAKSVILLSSDDSSSHFSGSGIFERSNSVSSCEFSSSQEPSELFSSQEQSSQETMTSSQETVTSTQEENKSSSYSSSTSSLGYKEMGVDSDSDVEPLALVIDLDEDV